MIPWLDSDDDHTQFPKHSEALTEPDGLLAAGGSLRPLRLLQAYRNGIFPWYNPGEPILWWSPSQRAVIYPEKIHVSRRLQRELRNTNMEITYNTAFREVMLNCAAPRKKSLGTWITEEMIEAYCELNKLGFARSVECNLFGKLVGGIYGVQLGRVFFGESMFSLLPNASKIALIDVARSPDVSLIDCQMPNPHLETMGMQLIPRRHFLQLLKRYCEPAKPVHSIGSTSLSPESLNPPKYR